MWLRVLGLLVAGGLVQLVISLPALANEDQSSRPTGLYVASILLIGAVASRSYVVVRRCGGARWRAGLVAVAVVPGVFCVEGLILFLMVSLYSG